MTWFLSWPLGCSTHRKPGGGFKEKLAAHQHLINASN